jgi:hypothetical protein
MSSAISIRSADPATWPRALTQTPLTNTEKIEPYLSMNPESQVQQVLSQSHATLELESLEIDFSRAHAL